MFLVSAYDLEQFTNVRLHLRKKVKYVTIKSKSLHYFERTRCCSWSGIWVIKRQWTLRSVPLT